MKHIPVPVHQEGIHVELARNHVKQGPYAVEVNLAQIGLFRIVCQNVVAVVEHHDDATFSLVYPIAQGLLDKLNIDILGNDPLHVVVLVADGLRNRENFLVLGFADGRPRNCNPLIAGCLQVPVLGAVFRNALVERIPTGTDVFAVRRPEEHIHHVVILQYPLGEHVLCILLGNRAYIGKEFREFRLARVQYAFAGFDRLAEHDFGTAVRGRDERIFEVENKRKNKHYRRYHERYRVDKRNAPTEFTAL